MILGDILFNILCIFLITVFGILFFYLLYILGKLKYKQRKFLREHLLKEDYNEYCRIGNEDYEKD